MAKRDLVLGLDLGTSGCKVSLVDREGAIAGQAGEGYPTHSPHPAWAEQNPADWKRSVIAAVRRVLAETGIPSGRVAALALTSAAHIGVLLDERGEPVRPAILWNDQRTVAEVADLERQAGDDILQATYQAVSTSWTLPHLLWVRRHDGEAWSRTRFVMLSKDYLLKWMTGSAHTDPATAVSSQLYDVRAGLWSDRLCDLAGVKTDMLPRIVASTDQAGELTSSAAELLALTAGTPVITGTLDSATELLAAGLCASGDSLVRLASAGGVQRVVQSPSPHRHRITYPHPLPPLWYCQAGTNTCASAVQWAARLFAGEAELSYEAYDAAAAQVPPGAEGLLFHPYLAGERAPHWDPLLRGSFTGLSLRHGRGHLARAVYEGTAFSIRQATTALAEGPEGPGLLAVAGGGTRSDLWVTILSNVLGRTLRIVKDADSSYGAALIGLSSLGLGGDLHTIASARAKAGRLVHPEAGQQAFYTQWFDAYVEVHRRLAPFYAQVAHPPGGK